MKNADKILAYYQFINQFGKENGYELKVIEPGKIEYTFTIEEKHLATPVAAHGGVLAALADALIGVAALSAVAEELKLVSTIEFKINYLKPAFLNDKIVGKALVLNKGNRIIAAEAEIFNAKTNELLAKAIGTLNAYPIEKSPFYNDFLKFTETKPSTL